jgi:hypothetical protein
MDQSKGHLGDDQLIRLTALQLAIGAHAKENGWPDDIIVQARQFYLFLAQKDPCVDLGQDKHDNVVSMLEDYGFE